MKTEKVEGSNMVLQLSSKKKKQPWLISFFIMADLILFFLCSFIIRSRSLVGEAAETREADKRRDEVLLIQTRFDHGRDLGFFGCASRIMPGSILLS